MTDIIAGRVMKNEKDRESGQQVDMSAAEVMANAIFEGMQGKLILSHNQYGNVVANPLHAVKLYHDYMLRAKELKIRVAELKKKEKGATGGIRVVLLNPVADPLLRPGQKPRPLRLLGQDPSTPLPDATGTATDAQPSPDPVPAHADGARKSANPQSTSPAITPLYDRPNPQASPAPAPNSEDGFDPAELIEDFEDPICQFCVGTKWVRDENGINMVACHYCEGKGRAPAPE